MAAWKETADAAMTNIGALVKGNPGILDAVKALGEATENKKALDAKTRELISLAVAATTRCDGCISIHAQEAVKAGASRDELLEALAVAINLNAGAALVYSSRILEAFDQASEK